MIRKIFFELETFKLVGNQTIGFQKLINIETIM